MSTDLVTVKTGSINKIIIHLYEINTATTTVCLQV